MCQALSDMRAVKVVVIGGSKLTYSYNIAIARKQIRIGTKSVHKNEIRERASEMTQVLSASGPPVWLPLAERCTKHAPSLPTSSSPLLCTASQVHHLAPLRCPLDARCTSACHACGAFAHTTYHMHILLADVIYDIVCGWNAGIA